MVQHNLTKNLRIQIDYQNFSEETFALFSMEHIISGDMLSNRWKKITVFFCFSFFFHTYLQIHITQTIDSFWTKIQYVLSTYLKKSNSFDDNWIGLPSQNIWTFINKNTRWFLSWDLNQTFGIEIEMCMTINI